MFTRTVAPVEAPSASICCCGVVEDSKGCDGEEEAGSEEKVDGDAATSTRA
jgi:hypothetical protein